MSERNPTATDHIRDAMHPHDHEHSPRTIMVWRVLTPISWLLVFVTSIIYTFSAPNDGKHQDPKHHDGKHHQHIINSRGTIWGQNRDHHTPFALNSIIVSIYWIVLYLVQLTYAYNLFAPAQHITSAINLAPSFTLNNLLGFGFLHLWCRSHFKWALVLVIINFFNLTLTYFRFPKSPKWQHVAVLAGPLAWTFVSLYWTGAVAVHAHHTAARIVANVFVWTWLVYGGFYLFTFKDWMLGFCLSVLTAALGVGQFFTAAIALQWIFAFTIMAVLFILSFVVAFPEATGVKFGRGQVVSADREREPLLADE